MKVVVILLGRDPDLLHDNRDERFVHGAGLDLFELGQHVKAVFENADNRVLTVKLRRGREADVKLAAGRALLRVDVVPGARHGHRTGREHPDCRLVSRLSVGRRLRRDLPRSGSRRLSAA